jgi:DNA-binding GntR family transcriptional regulator
MNSGATAERVYDAVKKRVLKGAYRPGDRIDVAALAQQLASSATPVRDALHLLAGERLVETRAGDGFHVPQLDAPALDDLYAWSRQILLLALKGRRACALGSPRSERISADAGDIVGDIFERVGTGSDNPECVREIQSINDRLHAVRIAESTVINDWCREIAALKDAIEHQHASALRRLISDYHRRRQRTVMETIRVLTSMAKRSDPSTNIRSIL